MKQGWNIASARASLQKESNLDRLVQSIFYRPFDGRLIYYHDSVVWRTVKQVMQHMIMGSNLGLVTKRQVNGDFRHVVATRSIIDNCTASLETRERSYLFPLYLYPEPPKDDLWAAQSEPLPNTPGHRRANLAPEFVADFAARLGLAWIPDGKGDRATTFGPEDVFAYIYAVLHAPGYRERYAEMLKEDFPRVPLTRDVGLFRELCAIGGRLVALHLMEADAKGAPSYPIGGSNLVERVRYTEPGQGAEQGRIWINQTQFFEGVPPEVWEFHIGGYQVSEKWLKDRKGRTLTYDDLRHYQQVVAALAETRALMDRIDEVIAERGGWPLVGSVAMAPAPSPGREG